jgi:hypothetical protein
MITSPDILAVMHRHLDRTFVPDAAEQIAHMVEELLARK